MYRDALILVVENAEVEIIARRHFIRAAESNARPTAQAKSALAALELKLTYFKRRLVNLTVS